MAATTNVCWNSTKQGELFALTTQGTLFERTKAETAAWNKKRVKTLTETINKLEQELDEIKSNKIYENAFRWRFEFPEVLNDEILLGLMWLLKSSL